MSPDEVQQLVLQVREAIEAHEISGSDQALDRLERLLELVDGADLF